MNQGKGEVINNRINENIADCSGHRDGDAQGVAKSRPHYRTVLSEHYWTSIFLSLRCQFYQNIRFLTDSTLLCSPHTYHTSVLEWVLVTTLALRAVLGRVDGPLVTHLSGENSFFFSFLILQHQGWRMSLACNSYNAPKLLGEIMFMHISDWRVQLCRYRQHLGLLSSNFYVVNC